MAKWPACRLPAHSAEATLPPSTRAQRAVSWDPVGRAVARLGGGEERAPQASARPRHPGGAQAASLEASNCRCAVHVEVVDARLSHLADVPARHVPAALRRLLRAQ
eukprot:1400506-Pyramimonas_sp.AAC.1